MPNRSFLVILFLSVVAGLPTASSSFADGVTPLDLERIKTVTSVVISPSGDQVAYTLRVPRDPFEDNGAAHVELHLTTPGGDGRPYVTGKVNVSDVAWNPDGSSISFLAKRGEDKVKGLYGVPLDGGEAQLLYAHEADIASYAYRPGKESEIAFIAKEKESAESKERKEQGFNQEIYEEEGRFNYVWLVDLSQESPKARKLQVSGHPSVIEWSPDGSRLAMAVAPTTLVDDSLMKRRLHIYDVNRDALVQKFQNPGKLGSFSWSPEGDELVVIASETIHDPAPGRLMLASMKSGALVDLLPGLKAHVRSAHWSKGRELTYLVDQRVETYLASLTVPPKTPEIKTGDEGVPSEDSQRVLISNPGQIFTSLSSSEDGDQLALLGHSSDHPAEVFHFVKGSSPERLTQSNRWLKDVSLGKQEVVTYQARDGLELDGLLIRPLNEAPGKRYPLILMIHGGPESHFRNGWISNYAVPGQVAAAQGFAVFYPNYRASTGRGVEFSMLDHGDFAGKEFDDLVDAIDHLVNMGLVDRQKVGVTGRSYGGFASAWCATALSEHFAASVMGVGLTDQLSFFGTTDIPNEMKLVHFRLWPWDNWQFYLERSPIFHTPSARTPLLILHGKADTRVYPGQSIEIYRYLKTLGKVPVRLVLYPGEGHGTRKAAARLDSCLRLLRWMEHYLKGPGGDPPVIDLDYEALQSADQAAR